MRFLLSIAAFSLLAVGEGLATWKLTHQAYVAGQSELADAQYEAQTADANRELVLRDAEKHVRR